MNEMQVFNNPEFGAVRTLMIEGEPWAVGKDIAAALGYKNTRQSLVTNVDDEDKDVHSMDTPGGKQPVVIINESGIYSLILSSKLPSAKRFKRWITSEVLPAIRATGGYGLKETQHRTLTPDDFLRAAQIVAVCKNERLPYVLDLISQAGIEPATLPSPRIEKDTTTADLINRAYSEYGMTLRGLERATGISITQICRIRQGSSFPNAMRAKIIKDAIARLVPEMDMG